MKRLPAWLTFVVIRLIGATLRMTTDDRGGILNQPSHPPVIIAFWHNRTALMVYFYERYCRGRTFLTFISSSRDGQFITDVAARFGIKAVRGSSSRHGTSAMLAAIRAAADPQVDLVITPDGPRGPRYEIQPGLLRLARVTGRPIIAVTYHLKWKFRLSSWDRFHIPLPFSTCHLMTSDPVCISPDASDAEMAGMETRLTELLGIED